MRTRHLAATAFALALGAATTTPLAQVPDPGPRIAAQREAMAPLAYMDGVWRGPASTTLPSGEKRTIVQTERIGPFLGGAVKMIEGRPPMRFFEMTLKRVGDTDWPVGNPIPPK